MNRNRIIAVLAALALATACFAAPTAQKLLPAKGELKAWTVVPDSLTYVKEDKLEELYNGGANVYRDHGVQEAAQQLYQRKNDILEVSVLVINTPANAKKFYEYWKKDTKSPKVVLKNKNGEAFMSKSNPVIGYIYTGKYMATVTPAYSGKSAVQDTETTLKMFANKLGKTLKK